MAEAVLKLARSRWTALLIVAVVALQLPACRLAVGGPTPAPTGTPVTLQGVTSTPGSTASLTQAPATASPTPKVSPSLTPSPTSPAPSPSPTSGPSPTPIPTSRAGEPLAARDLQAEVACSQDDPRLGIAWLSWKPSGTAGREQRVEVTIFSFESEDSVEASGALPPGQSTLTWNELHGQAILFWRVLTLHSLGWVSSEIASFVGPTCAADIQPPHSP